MKKKLVSLLVTSFMIQNVPTFKTSFANLETSFNKEQINKNEDNSKKENNDDQQIEEPLALEAKSKSTPKIVITKVKKITTTGRKTNSTSLSTVSSRKRTRPISKVDNIESPSSETSSTTRTSSHSSAFSTRKKKEDPSGSISTPPSSSKEQDRLYASRIQSNKKVLEENKKEENLNQELIKYMEEIEAKEIKYLESNNNSLTNLSDKAKEEQEKEKENFLTTTKQLKNQINQLRLLDTLHWILKEQRDLSFEEEELFELKREFNAKTSILNNQINEIISYKSFISKELYEKKIIKTKLSDEIFKYNNFIMLVVTYETWKKFEDIIKVSDKKKSIKEIEDIVINFKLQNYKNHPITTKEISPLIEMIFDNFITYSMIYPKTNNLTINIYKDLNAHELLYEDSDEEKTTKPDLEESFNEYVNKLKLSILKLKDEIESLKEKITTLEENIIKIKIKQIEIIIEHEIIKNDIKQKIEHTKNREEYISDLKKIKVAFYELKNRYSSTLETYYKIKELVKNEIISLKEITNDIKKQEEEYEKMFKNQKSSKTTLNTLTKVKGWNGYYKITLQITSETWAEIENWFFTIPYKQRIKTPLYSKIYNLTRLGDYSPTSDEIAALTRLIFDHFSYYHDKYMQIKNNPTKALEITSYSDYENGFWFDENPDYYNKIITLNNDEKHLKFEKLSIANEKSKEIRKAKDKELKTKAEIEIKSKELERYEKLYKEEVEKFTRFIIYYQITLAQNQFLETKKEIIEEKLRVENNKTSWDNLIQKILSSHS